MVLKYEIPEYISVQKGKFAPYPLQWLFIVGRLLVWGCGWFR